MDLLGLFLIVSSVACFVATGILNTTGHEYGFPLSGLAFLFFGILSLGIGVLLTWLAFRLFLRRLGAPHFSLSGRISGRWGGSRDIVFAKDGGVWSCGLPHTPVPFNLKGCFFKKQFLIAFAIRAVRYPVVSGKLPIAFLGKRTLTGFPKGSRIEAVFQGRTREKRVTLVQDGKSKCGFIALLIIKSKLPPRLEKYKPIGKGAGNQVTRINEEIYINSP